MDVIDQLVKNDNNTNHSTILMKPRYVNNWNEAEVWKTLFGHRFAESLLPKCKVDFMVRISKYSSTFTNGYETNFTVELFKVEKRRPYELIDHEGEPITGKFYMEELSAVDKKFDDEYRVDYILNMKTLRGKKMVRNRTRTYLIVAETSFIDNYDGKNRN